MTSNFKEKVYHAVSSIPEGKVATYGQIAFMCGSPRASRIVGAILATVHGGMDLPCHRVVYSDGRLCEHSQFADQRRLLKEENVVFLNNGHVDLRKSGI